MIKFGLKKGSADMIGFKSVLVDDAFIQRFKDKHVAIFTSIEVKTSKGRISAEQKDWFDSVNLAGGIAIIARDLEDLETLID